ncbi:RECQ4 helicase, partial [Sclerurus mexicanus]|nr:RECQ4 helicase [Sclerurus mexicanus]
LGFLQVLRDQLGVRCFLALTATATAATARDVCQHLGIPEDSRITAGSGVIPENLQLSVSVERDRDEALLSLLRRDPFASMDSLLVFCTRREDTERVAALIQSHFPGNPIPGNAKGGRALSPSQIPEIPIIFGVISTILGINSRIPGFNEIMRELTSQNYGNHFPKNYGIDSQNKGFDPQNYGNMEAFVQHCGRAGRDGRAARCHLLLEQEGRDLPELRRHIFGNTLEFWALKKLLLEVFAPCRCRETLGKIRDGNSQKPLEKPLEKPPGRCRGHERALNMEETSERLDMSQEGIETLLCSLELLPRPPLRLLLPTLSRCRIRCPGGARQLRQGAQRCPPLAAFLARERQAGRDVGNSGSVEFDVVELSDSMGWESGLVKRELRRLQWGERGGRSGIAVEFQGLSFHVVARGDLAGPELDSLGQALLRGSRARQREALRQLRACARAFRSVAFQGCEAEPPERELESRSARLKDIIREHFQRDGPGAQREQEEEEERMEREEEELGRERLRDWESCVRSDIRHLLAAHPEEKFSGRAIARIFHGIGSPRFPAEIYGRDRRFWRKHLQLDFHGLSRLATQEILGNP